MRKAFKSLGFLAPFALPLMALAQTPPPGLPNNYNNVLPGGQDALGILGVISQIFGVLIPILITAAVVWVIVGIIKYATAKDDEAKNEGRKTMIHAIIALFVIVSIWGLVAILNNTFGVGQAGSNVGVCQPVYDPVSGTFVPPPGC